MNSTGATTCKVCHRPLKTVASVDAGMGPVCAGKSAARKNRPLQTELGRADYDVCIDRAEKVISITDNNKGGRTVTNDADNVLRDMVAATGCNLDGWIIVWRDTDGIWDGMEPQITGSTSAYFYSLGGTRDKGKAIARAKVRRAGGVWQGKAENR